MAFVLGMDCNVEIGWGFWKETFHVLHFDTSAWVQKFASVGKNPQTV